MLVKSRPTLFTKTASTLTLCRSFNEDFHSHKNLVKSPKPLSGSIYLGMEPSIGYFTELKFA